MAVKIFKSFEILKESSFNLAICCPQLNIVELVFTVYGRSEEAAGREGQWRVGKLK